MQRIDAIVGERIRLVQPTAAATISIFSENGSTVVDAEPTNSVGPLPLKYFNFTPPAEGAYLVSWNGEPSPFLRWEAIDARVSSIRWLAERIKAKTDNLPPAATG